MEQSCGRRMGCRSGHPGTEDAGETNDDEKDGQCGAEEVVGRHTRGRSSSAGESARPAGGLQV